MCCVSIYRPFTSSDNPSKGPRYSLIYIVYDVGDQLRASRKKCRYSVWILIYASWKGICFVRPARPCTYTIRHLSACRHSCFKEDKKLSLPLCLRRAHAASACTCRSLYGCGSSMVLLPFSKVFSTSGGDMYSCGKNNYGQLGLDGGASRHTPVREIGGGKRAGAPGELSGHRWIIGCVDIYCRCYCCCSHVCSVFLGGS